MIVLWWLASSILGLLALPLVTRVFKQLPDRGYAFARPLGLMGASFVLWLGASLHLVPNNAGGAIGSLLLFGTAALLLGRREGLLEWLRSERWTVAAMELVFAGSFVLWAFVRANNPEIQATEKPMELAFLNGILRSGSFPPLDPWLSGYGISYYYFGYVMVGQLTMLTGATSGVAFNLTSALWFAMVATGSYGLLYNLMTAEGRLRLKQEPASERRRAKRQEGRMRAWGRALLRATPLLLPLLGPLFVLVTGNLEAILDVLHSRHLFWTSGSLSSGFWSWLDIQQLTDPPVGDPSWMPQRFLWWWRASRVVHDVNLAGSTIEVIDEFPFFSFLLADNHPHLLAMPYALSAVGLALQAFLGGKPGPFYLRKNTLSVDRLIRIVRWVLGAVVALVVVRAGLGTAGVLGGEPLSVLEAIRRGVVELLLLGAGLSLLAILALVLIGWLPSLLERGQFAFGAWLFGGLAFLNTWDSPIYLVLLVAVLAYINRKQPLVELLLQLAYTSLAVGTAAILLYLPWYPSFASQVGGVLVNLLFPTRIQHFLVMFGVSLIPISVWLIGALRRSSVRLDLIWKVGLGLLVALVFGGALLGLANYLALTRQPAGLESVLSSLGVSGMSLQQGLRAAFSEAARRRLTASWTTLILCATVGASAALFLARRGRGEQPEAERGQGKQHGEASSVVSGKSGDRPDLTPFVVTLVGIGALLILAPEFVYLRDLFGTRMNTVFKFYFAAWILWGLAAAYACVQLWPRSWNLRSVLRLAVYLPLLMGLVYPALATWTRANGFAPLGGRTLDGTAYLATSDPSDLEAFHWIQQNLPTGVIAEAVGGSYSQYGRVSAHTGLPTVLGWGGHEVQWRGNAVAQGSREQDIQRLYQTNSWPEAATLLEQYGIDYVYVGSLERSRYPGLNESKFAANMQLVYQNLEVRIYAEGAVQ